MLIYLITNTANGKLYVGQTNQPKLAERLAQHCQAAGRGSMQLICRAIRKHGKAAFTIEQIDSAETREQANELERHHIARLRCMEQNVGYNRSPGGAVVNEGPLSPEHRRKISEANKANPCRSMLGRRHTPEAIALMSEKKKGTPKSEEHRKHISEARMGISFMSDESRNAASERMKGNAFGKGFQHTEDAKRRIRESATGRYHTSESKAKISAAKIGHAVSEETRAKFSAAGKALSPEHMVSASS